MTRPLLATALAFGTLAALATPALAHDGARRQAAACRAAAGSPAQTEAAIRANLERLGYRVDSVRLDEGCYVARAVNNTGLPISVRYDPATGDLVLARLRS